MKYFVRFTNHIEQDLARNWSSWNYGQRGFTGTYAELREAITEAIDEDRAFEISGLELWGRDAARASYGELYPNYWVVIDDREGTGISTVELDATDLESAINEARRADLYCDGKFLDVENWQPVIVYREAAPQFDCEMIILACEW
jgi:hypothetical protein